MAAQTSTVTGDGGPIDFAPTFTYAGFRLGRGHRPVRAARGRGARRRGDPQRRRRGGRLRRGPTASSTGCTGPTCRPRSTLHGIPEDTPTREKRGWTADAHIAAEATINNKRHGRLLHQVVADLRDATGSDGWVPDIVPTELGTGWATRSDPAWASATALMPYYVWKQYGDERVIAEHYDAMAAWVDYVGTRSTDFLVTNPTGQWGNDWLSIETTEGKPLPVRLLLLGRVHRRGDRRGAGPRRGRRGVRRPGAEHRRRDQRDLLQRAELLRVEPVRQRVPAGAAASSPRAGSSGWSTPS